MESKDAMELLDAMMEVGICEKENFADRIEYRFNIKTDMTFIKEITPENLNELKSILNANKINVYPEKPPYVAISF